MKKWGGQYVPPHKTRKILVGWASRPPLFLLTYPPILARCDRLEISGNFGCDRLLQQIASSSRYSLLAPFV
ncbi:hypothetical protein MiSe_33400 [Microseira wollei NIES-4236]|uniref:Uncharacterized protein n=1 Tax=Microseira wollei NIES-4236 TaxID=2530354 RepID=A0AAV3X6S9_9CYAN|nr:hypothetical protein MiSe_33400 [Microseira wollei NIES-4236]